MADEPTQPITPEAREHPTCELGVTGLFQAAESTSIDLLPGASEHIGRYRIIESIGEGGMGTVYKAEQRRPIQRIVAVKVIKLGFDTREVVARFDAERQALARMDHPGIAKVLDAGADTITGRPYFVMEYVPGQPITRFCDEQRLTVRQRLEVFQQVCDAIAHAHTKSILHRDIKASNVLGYLQDGKPAIKVIDFGIAKAVAGAPLADGAMHTAAGQVVGTFETMSPEQSAGDTDVDTRTDVYALGVLLYELLSGTRPFATEQLRVPHEELRRMIREDAPQRPSTRLSKLGPAARQVAEARRARLEDLERQLRSELEWIPLKAMRKERERRYASVAQLGDDVGNYLAGRPLSAGPETASYRAWKFVGRHRAALSGAAAMLIVLVAGVVVSTWQAIRATHAEVLAAQRADNEHRERTRAEASERATRRELARSLMAQGQAQHAGDQPGPAKRQYERAAAELLRAGDDSFEADLLLTLTWAQSPPPLQDVPIHMASEDRVVLSADGRRAVTANEGRLYVWDLLRGIGVRTVSGSDGGAWKVLAADSSGRLIVTARKRADERDEIVQLWDVESDRLVQSFAGHSGDVSAAAVSDDGGTLVTGGADKTVRVWNVETGQARFDPVRQAGPILAVAISPSADRVVACADGVATAAVIDARSGVELRPLATGRPHWTGSAVFVPGGRYVAVQPRNKPPRVFDVESGRSVRDYMGGVNGYETGLVTATKDREAMLLAGHLMDGKVLVWDLTTGAALFQLDEASPPGVTTWGPVSVSRNGRFAALKGARCIRHWSLDPPPSAGQEFQIHDLAIRALTISADSRLAVASTKGPNGALVAWDLVTNRAVARLPAGAMGGFNGVAFTGGGYRVAYCANNGALGVWDVSRGEAATTAEIGSQSGGASCLAASADGKWIVTGGSDGRVRVWDVAGRRQVSEVAAKAASARPVRIVAVGFLQDDRHIVAVTDDGIVQMTDSATGAVLRTSDALPHARLIGLSATAIGAGRVFVGVGGTVHAWDAERGAWVWSVEADKVSTAGIEVVPSAGGTARVLTSADDGIRVWDAETGRELFTVKGDMGKRLALSADGRFLVTARGSYVSTLDLHGPRRRRALLRDAEAARVSLGDRPANGQALLQRARWWASCGIDDWAAETMERARAAGAAVSPMQLGQVYWRLGRASDAAREFRAAAAGGEAPAAYLELCAAAAERPVDLPRTRSFTRPASRPVLIPAIPLATQPEEQ